MSSRGKTEPMTDTNRRIVLAQRPTGMVDEHTTRLEESPVPTAGPGEALVRVRHLSIDPTIRGWLNEVDTYLPAIRIGEVIRSAGLGEIVATNGDGLKVGDTVFGRLGWQDYAIVPATGPETAQVVPPGIDAGTALGLLGVTGLTAWFGLTDVGRMVTGDHVVVSGAAGATGSVVGQLARIQGAATVVGLAGTDDKCRAHRRRVGARTGGVEPALHRRQHWQAHRQGLSPPTAGSHRRQLSECTRTGSCTFSTSPVPAACRPRRPASTGRASPAGRICGRRSAPSAATSRWRPTSRR